MAAHATMSEAVVHTLTVVSNGALGAAVAHALESAGLPAPRVVGDVADAPSADLAIVALERATLGALLGIGRTLLVRGDNALFVTCEGDTLVSGPVTVPRVTACFECRLRLGLDGQA